MDDDEKNIGVFGKLPGQLPNEFVSGVTIVHGQGTANAEHAGLFPDVGGDGAGHGMLQGGDAFATASLLGQTDGFFRS